MLRKMPKYQKILRNIAYKVFNRIENNGNIDPNRNGEYFLILSLLRFKKNLKRELTIFDVGANIGNYTKLILELASKLDIHLNLHLFEPQKSCYEILTKLYGDKKNIKINNFGASDKETTAILYYDTPKSGLASIYKRNLKHYQIDFNHSEEIQLKRLDEYILSMNIEHIDFIKIDVEGHELSVLKGLGNFLNYEFIDFIQFEYGGANIDSRTYLLDFYSLLEEKGFKIAKIMPNYLELREYHPFMENFCYQNYVAISNKILEILAREY